MLSLLYLARVLCTNDAEVYPQAHVSCESKIVVCLILGRNADVEWGRAIDLTAGPAVRGPGLLGSVEDKPLIITHSCWEPI